MQQRLKDPFEEIEEATSDKELIDPEETDTSEKHNSILCDTCERNSTVYLFRMVFQTAQKPDEKRDNTQKLLTWLLSGLLGAQVLWAMILIPFIVFNQTIISSASLPFLTLLVTAILGEVVAMAFVVVRFIFKSPITDMLDILKELIHSQQKK